MARQQQLKIILIQACLGLLTEPGPLALHGMPCLAAQLYWWTPVRALSMPVRPLSDHAEPSSATPPDAPVAADMAKAGESISSLTGLPQTATSAAFSLLIGAGCALLAPQTLDKANTVLVGLVIASFLVSTRCDG